MNVKRLDLLDRESRTQSVDCPACYHDDESRGGCACTAVLKVVQCLYNSTELYALTACACVSSALGVRSLGADSDVSKFCARSQFV